MSLTLTEALERGAPFVETRCCLGCSRRQWTSERRASYLLRDVPDVPLSLDPGVTVPFFDGACGHSPVRLIGVSLPTSAEGRARMEGWRLHDFVPSPATFAGFDVVDLQYSALSNCGYGTEALLASARTEWAADLNVSHLFEDRSAAERFVTASNTRIPEHAPFVLAAVYLVGA